MSGYTENLVAKRVAEHRIPARDDHQLELLIQLRERHTIRAYREEAIRDEALNHPRRMPNRRALCGKPPQSTPSLYMDL
ncbi:hypothetical protein N7516_009770 [Penicillium verrucosum]|uniref:uncharacterized protein n=1 Tax=Penicillium verrucosum TaxID=60171 RepID=UPI0025456ADF|nr:uncharacterized protein N7516_009770 [Penicillium verrucosum]KAJ5922067.1 hypothetical protein N7516_009770 [Penicillium verrucosum]